MKQWVLTMLILCTAMTPLSAQTHEPLPEWRFGVVTAYTAQDMESEFSPEVFPDAKAIFEQSAPGGKAPGSISTFLIQVPTLDEKPMYILVDTGLGIGRPGSPSRLLDNLKKAGHGDGVTPDDISIILLTHLHGDHIGGLLDGENRRFPNAKVLCCKAEYDYWIGQDNPQVGRIKRVYGDDFRGQFAFGESLSLNGEREFLSITTVDAHGHTPGHTAFLLESGGEKLLIIGDTVHAAAVQFAHPEVCARYDMDARQAVESRKRLLDMAASDNIPIAGMHLPGTGFALIKKDTTGGYRHTLLDLPLASLGFRRTDSGLLVDYGYWGVPGQEYRRDRPAEEALEWLEAELKSGRCSVMALSDMDKADWENQRVFGEKFLERIKQLAHEYQVPYSMEYAISHFPGSSVTYHFP